VTFPRLLTAALVATLVAAETAYAHALLLKTSPPRRAVLRDPPKIVELWFNERLEPAYASVTVSAQSGSPVITSGGRVTGEDPKRLSLELPTLSPGNYIVRFRVLSVDGHAAEDSFTFSVRQ
jgi:copper resistance protein C